MANDAHFCGVLLDHLDNCPVCTCPRVTFGVGGCPGVCECECHDSRQPEHDPRVCFRQVNLAAVHRSRAKNAEGRVTPDAE